MVSSDAADDPDWENAKPSQPSPLPSSRVGDDLHVRIVVGIAGARNLHGRSFVPFDFLDFGFARFSSLALCQSLAFLFRVGDHDL
jgi:hypothetical protein